MNGSDLHLTTAVSRQLRQLLQSFCTDAGTIAASLLDQCGTQLASGRPTALAHSPDLFSDAPEIAALAAGAFASTRELAARLGDDRFDGLVHHGREKHFYLCPVARDYLLLAVFGTGTPTGVVRHCATRLVPHLETALAAAATPPPGWQQPPAGPGVTRTQHAGV